MSTLLQQPDSHLPGMLFCNLFLPLARPSSIPWCEYSILLLYYHPPPRSLIWSRGSYIAEKDHMSSLVPHCLPPNVYVCMFGNPSLNWNQPLCRLLPIGLCAPVTWQPSKCSKTAGLSPSVPHSNCAVRRKKLIAPSMAGSVCLIQEIHQAGILHKSCYISICPVLTRNLWNSNIFLTAIDLSEIRI